MAKVNLLIDSNTWETFRIACITRHISASKAVERLIKQELGNWEDDAAREKLQQENLRRVRTPISQGDA